MTPTRHASRSSGAWAAGAVVLVLVAGCAPELDPQQYGQVIYEVPRVEGADKPYPLPQLETPAKKPESDVK